MNARRIIALLYTLCFVLNLVFGQPTTATCDESCTARQRADTIKQQLHQILGHLQRLDRKVNEFEVKIGQLEMRINASRNVSTEKAVTYNKTECTSVKSIGQAEVIANISSFFGAWMKDVAFPDSQKIYVLQHYSNKVRQYADTAALKTSTHEKEYTLPTHISGSGLVYNDSIYYSAQRSTNMYQFNMATGQNKTLVLPGAGYHKNCEYFTNDNSETAIDIEVDERGLWFIFGNEDDNCSFVIAKINPISFTIEWSWALPWSRFKQTTGEAFMKCGKLYIIDNATNKPTYVAYVFDTESGQGRVLGSTDIVYPNTYTNTLSMSYNINDKNLYVWHSDEDRVVRYPVM